MASVNESPSSMNSETGKDDNKSHADEQKTNDDADGAQASDAQQKEGGGQDSSRYECNICLDTARDAVISMCGHLFCWPCLHQWLETRPTRQTCPVCKSAISREKVIPLYGRGGDQSDPRDKVPPRPQGQRSEPSYTGFPGFNWGGNGGDGGIQFSFGIGAFPFTMFASTLNFGDRRPAAPTPGSRQHEEEVFISKVFIWIALLFMVWLLLA